MTRSGQYDLERVKAACSIEEIVGEYVPLSRRGARLVGVCPFHEDKGPSLSVSPEKQLWMCFGCRLGGDVYSFVSRIEGLTFGQTVQRLAERAGVQPEGRSAPPPSAIRKIQDEALAEDCGAFWTEMHRAMRRRAGNLWRLSRQGFRWAVANHEMPPADWKGDMLWEIVSAAMAVERAAERSDEMCDTIQRLPPRQRMGIYRELRHHPGLAEALQASRECDARVERILAGEETS